MVVVTSRPWSQTLGQCRSTGWRTNKACWNSEVYQLRKAKRNSILPTQWDHRQVCYGACLSQTRIWMNVVHAKFHDAKFHGGLKNSAKKAKGPRVQEEPHDGPGPRVQEKPHDGPGPRERHDTSVRWISNQWLYKIKLKMNNVCKKWTTEIMRVTIYNRRVHANWKIW